MAKQTNDTTSAYLALKDEILGGSIKPFYLLFGKEHYFIDSLCSLLMEKAISPEEAAFAQTVFYGQDVTAQQVVSIARQFPMMASRQLVVVKEAQMMPRIEDIALYFEAVMPSTVLVICYKTPNDISKSPSRSIDKRTTFYKQACKVGVVFESQQIPDYRMGAWIESYFTSSGLSITPDGAALLAEHAGNDISRVVSEADKLLKLFPEGHKKISAADIAENVGVSRDYSVFELTKALSLKDVKRCYRLARFFAESEKRFPLQMILPSLASHFLKILRMHALAGAGVSRAEILSQLGINPYFGAEYDSAMRNYPVKKTMKVISILKDYDQRSKSNARGEAADGDLLIEMISRILA